MGATLVIDNCSVELHNELDPSQWAITVEPTGEHFVSIYLDNATVKFQVEVSTTRDAIALETGLPLEGNPAVLISQAQSED